MFSIAIFMSTAQVGYAAESNVSFKDVEKHWAKQAISQASEEQLLSGYEDGTFRPNATITRAEFTTILSRLLELPASGESTAFKDISGNWAEGAISSAVQADIIVSSEFGSKFEPTKAITRLEMAKMIGRSLALQADYELYIESFKGLYNGDIPVTDWKKIKAADVPLVGLAFGSGIVGGYPDDSFGLDKNATRAEATVMLLRLKDAKEKNPEEFMALKELKAVAETGSNISVVEPEYRLSRNLVNDPLEIDHTRYNANVKRLYVINHQKGHYKSIYFNKFIGDKNKRVNQSVFESEGLAVAVTDLTPTYSESTYFTFSSIKLGSQGHPEVKGLSQKFGYRNPRDNEDNPYTTKNLTEEWVFYGKYDRKENSVLRMFGANATKGSNTIMMTFNGSVNQ